LQDNTTDTAVVMHNGKKTLPLYNFFIALKHNNFLVTPGQIADSNIIIDAYSPLVKNEAELCPYLSPVFANSQEEQLQFKQIFDVHFKMATADGNGENKKSKKIFWQQHWWKFTVALISIAAIVWYISSNILAAAIPSKPQINLFTDVEPVKYISAQKKITQRTASVWLNIVDIINPDYLKHVTKKVTYNWGDGTAPDTASKHIYNKEGNFNVTAYAGIYYRNNFQYTDTLRSAIAICFAADTLQLKTSIAGNIKMGDIITVTAINTGKKDTVVWSGAEDVADKKENGNAITLRYNKPGTQTIGCSAYNPYSAVVCEKTGTISFGVNDTAPKPDIIISVPATAKTLAPQYKVKSKLFTWLAILALLLMAATTYLYKLINRRKKQQQFTTEEIKEQYRNLRQSFLGKQGDVQLPFTNKNYLPLPEQEIEDVARQMRKRISDDAHYLHVQKTIYNAINHAGFFQPVTAVRTQQSEYLVLIDDNTANSQQVKLFEYLLELLIKQNVFIEKYYYRTEPRLCYKEQGGVTVSLEKLSEKYPKHILLFLGNAYQLLYQLYPVIDSSYQPLLNRWQYKAILTPVSFLDWGNKEKKVLQDELPVLPVDIPGQILLLQKLFNEGINVVADLKLYHNEFYEALPVDFEDIDELHDYCDTAAWALQGGTYKNILFQWMAALAVYPKIRWELTLAIGKNILDAYGKTAELNFTTLLRIARIQWMKDGRFPDYTRLNLLKQLSRENEIIARETILEVLKEIPEIELSATHFAFEEKEVQRLTNEFTLYAYNPEKYAAYKNSRDLFEQLCADNNITDIPAKNYLENPEAKWDTLINEPAPATAGTIPLSNYFTVKPATGWQHKLYLYSFRTSMFLFVCSLSGLLGLTILHFLNSKKFPALTYQQPYTADVRVNIEGATGNIIVEIDSTVKLADSYQTAIVPVTVNDSSKNVKLSINGNAVLDTVMPVKFSGYNIAVQHNDSLPVQQPAVKITAKLLLNQNCVAGVYNYSSIIKDADNTITVTDSTVNDANISNSNLNNNADNAVCLNSIAYGAAVPKQKIEAVILNFKRNNIYLQQVPVPSYAVAASEIIIYQKTTAAPVDVKPIVFIQVSDNSLLQSAANFRNILLKDGIETKPVTIQQYNYNSEISYYNTAMQAAAENIKRYYNKYYPALNVQVKLRKTPDNGDYNNIIAVWVKMLDPNLMIKKTDYSISNIQLPVYVADDEPLTISFDIVNKNPEVLNVRQNAISKKIKGQVCVYSEPGCDDFTFTAANDVISITRKIDVSKKEPGKHEVRVIIEEFKINELLGSCIVEKSPQLNYNKKFILRDGNSQDFQSLIDALQKESYRVVKTPYTVDALAYLKKGNYDAIVIITDFKNSKNGETGIEFLKQLKSMPLLDNFIIYTSPQSEKKFGKDIMAMGYYQIVTNVYNLQQLLQKREGKKSAN
jgi:hypothetical protein